jgi:hypothetical protein
MEEFGSLPSDVLRDRVLKLVPAFHALREIGIRLLPGGEKESGRNRILRYFLAHVGSVIHTDELMVVSGITEYARRIREIRVQLGYHILSGKTICEMREAEGAEQVTDSTLSTGSPEHYMLLSEKQDRDAAHRWGIANEIRKLKIGTKEKLLKYLRANVGRPVLGEELIYVSKDATEWARRVRELRTDEGWPIKTKHSGRPDLPTGVYILEDDKQAQPHDRKIPDSVYVAVLMRDHYKCRKCGWDKALQVPGDKRHFLELHHLEHHAVGGANTLENLLTLCNVHHDEVHQRKLDAAGVLAWMSDPPLDLAV